MEPTFFILIVDFCVIGTGFQDVLVIFGVCSASIYRLGQAIVKQLISQIVVPYYFPVNMCCYFLIHFEFNCCEIEASQDFFIVTTNSYVDNFSIFDLTGE